MSLYLNTAREYIVAKVYLRHKKTDGKSGHRHSQLGEARIQN